MNTNFLTLNQNDLLSIDFNAPALFNSFINYLDATPKTVQTYTRSLKQFFIYLKDNSIFKPLYNDIKNYRDYLIATVKPTTVNAYIFAVKRFFSFTADAGLYPNVAGKIKGAKLDKAPKKDYLTSRQVKEVISNIDTSTEVGVRDYAIFSLMVTCGLRDIEVARANIEDIRSLGNKTVLYIQGKGKQEKNDFVILPEEVEEVIKAYLSIKGIFTNTAPLFTSISNNSINNALSTRSISKIIKTCMVKAGYNSTRLTAHSLRHTAVTLALMGNGGNIQAAKLFARHASTDTTEIYAHNLEKVNNNCSRIVANSIFK